MQNRHTKALLYVLCDCEMGYMDTAIYYWRMDLNPSDIFTVRECHLQLVQNTQPQPDMELAFLQDAQLAYVAARVLIKRCNMKGRQGNLKLSHHLANWAP